MVIINRSLAYFLSALLFSSLIFDKAFSEDTQRGMRPSKVFIDGRYVFCGGSIYGDPGIKKSATYTNDCYQYSQEGVFSPLDFKYPIKAYNIQSQIIDAENILFFGGYDGENYLKDSYELNLKSGVFIRVGDLPIGVSSHSSVRLTSGTILSIGGAKYEGSVPDIFAYDSQTKNWSAYGRLPSRRHYHASIALPNGDFAVIGGAVKEPPEGYSKPLLSEVLKFDSIDSKWELLAPLPQGQRGMEILELPGNKYLILGGQAEYSDECNPCYSKMLIYDFNASKIVKTIELDHYFGFTTSIFDGNILSILFGNLPDGLSQIQERLNYRVTLD